MENKILYKYGFVAITASLVSYLTIKTLIDAPDTVLITESIISGVILSPLLFILNNSIKFGKFSTLSINQQLINYGAIAILFIACWIGLEGVVLCIFTETCSLFIPLIPIRIFIALLLYIIIIIYWRDSVYNTTEQDDEITEPNKTREVASEIIERIAVKNGNNKIEVLPISEIIHLQAEGDYVMIYSTKGKFLKEQTMKTFQEILPSQFARIHRSDIINIEYITQIELYKQGAVIKLKNNNEVKASTNGYKTLKKVLNL